VPRRGQETRGQRHPQASPAWNSSCEEKSMWRKAHVTKMRGQKGAREWREKRHSSFTGTPRAGAAGSVSRCLVKGWHKWSCPLSPLLISWPQHPRQTTPDQTAYPGNSPTPQEGGQDSLS
jgi:hypothetical protein